MKINYDRTYHPAILNRAIGAVVAWFV